MIDTIIFDIGGVLIKEGHRININEHYGLPWDDAEYKLWNEYKVGKHTELEYWKKLLKGTHMEGKEKEVALHARKIYGSSSEGKANFLLPKLKSKGYRLAILSNHSVQWADEIIKNLKLDKYCGPIIISAAIGLAKPDPEIYKYALKAVNRFENPEKCVFIDDKIENIKSANNFGINGVHLTKEDNKESLEMKLKNLGIKISSSARSASLRNFS